MSAEPTRYAPGSYVYRSTLEDTVVSLSEPIQGRDGAMLKELAIPKDTGLIIAIRAANRSKLIWGEDAAEWKPERWLSSLPDTVVNARAAGVYSYM